MAESQMKDVGRGIARIDPADLERIGAEIGELISITGKRQSVVKAMPAYLSDRGNGIIQIDGIARENVQAGLDEKVAVAKVAHELARTVVIAPVSPMRSPAGSQHTTYVARLLEGRGLTAGDRVRVNLFGARPQDFTVVETAPKGAVLVQATTTVRIRGDGHSRGGAGSPLLRGCRRPGQGDTPHPRDDRASPQVPGGLPAPGHRCAQGGALHGPPGCGKTLIARAVAYETSAHFIHVTGPEIIHKFYGESEAHLRTVFQDAAEHAPSIVFLDEIDAIAPKREEVHGEVEKRVVAQLLALMDGLKSRGEVIVIGATNIPNSLDPALRRPGRFDREIAISIPDKNGRLEILEIHTRGMPLASDVDLERLSQITHGFVGADLEALCREAAMITLRRIMPTIDFETASIPYEKLQELEVTQDCFLEALREVEPSAIREVFTEIPDVKWSDVGGLDRVKRALMETVEWPLRHGRLFEHAHLIPAKGILLYGPPGTGKTLIAKAVASESEVNFISVKGPALLSKYVGESEKGVREVFKKAKQAAPCVVFFDEIDALAPVRTGYDTTHVSERVVSQFLTEMDGIEEMKGVVILAATNRIDMVDPALLRAGRFDTRIELPLPDMKSRLAIFEIHTRGKPLAKDVNLKNLAKLTDRLVGADIEAVCRTAGMVAVREFLEKHADSDDYSGFKIAARHFEQAMMEVSAAPGG